MAIRKEFLDILVCPKCKGGLNHKNMFIVCLKCKLAYPILDNDIPDMRIDDAWELPKAKKNYFKHSLKL